MNVQLCSLNPLTEHFTGTKVLTLFILFGVCLTMLDHYFCTNESKIYLMSKGNICITHVISTIKCTLSNNNNTFYLKAKSDRAIDDGWNALVMNLHSISADLTVRGCFYIYPLKVESCSVLT